MPLKESLFDISENRKTKVLHKGFDYKGRIFEKSMSGWLFREEKRKQILAKIEDVVYYLIESVKDIKNHVNYMVPKNSKNKN